MSTAWQFIHRTPIAFGRGLYRQVGSWCTGSKQLLLVTGARSLQASGRLADITNDLDQRGISWTQVQVDKEPDCALIDRLTEQARQSRCDTVLAVGGGSVLDSAKAIAALCSNSGACIDYLEDIPGNQGLRIRADPLRVIACPTTAGTGSEVTKNAVILAENFQVKRSMRDERLLPSQAVIDPELLQGQSRTTAGAAAIDAFTHLAESFLSTGASDMTDALARPGLTLAWRYLQELRDGTVTTAAEDSIAKASLWGGMCLANARLGAAHGLVAPLGGHFPIGHGAGIACLLPPSLRLTQSLATGQAAQPCQERLQELSRLITGSPDVEAASTSLLELRQQLGLHNLSHYGVTEAALPAIAASPSGSIKTHPVPLTQENCLTILREALVD